jgi:hypothetical protein
MKNVIFIYIGVFLMFLLLECKKDENKAIVSDNPVAPVIKTPVDGTSFVFSTANDLDSVTFIWSRTNFGFKSSNVNSIQFQKENTDFKKAKNFSPKNSNSDTLNIANGQINIAAKALGLPINQESNILVRVRTVLNFTDTVVSSTIKLKVTPH